MPSISRDQLLAPQVASTDPYANFVTLEGGEKVYIRPLSRNEAITVSELKEAEGTAAAEHYLLHVGIVEPALTLEDVQRWASQPGSADVINVVSRGIGVVSGMLPTSGKEAYKSV